MASSQLNISLFLFFAISIVFASCSKNGSILTESNIKTQNNSLPNQHSTLACQIPDSLQSAYNVKFAKLLYAYHVDSSMPSNLNPNWDYAFRVQSDTSNLKYLHAIPIYDEQDRLKHIVFIDHYSINYAILVVEAHYKDSSSLYNYLLKNDIEEGFEVIHKFIKAFNVLADCAANRETVQVRNPETDYSKWGDTFWVDLGHFFAGVWDYIKKGGSVTSGQGGIMIKILDKNSPPSKGPRPTTSGGGGT